ncbi:hypothetical protein MTBSS4_480004 [Magnetospirillum sp. SS-4]|nr:hypothetical protein MTBSS4_480004 [Magnetospirillum sp. SS-4]
MLRGKSGKFRGMSGDKPCTRLLLKLVEIGKCDVISHAIRKGQYVRFFQMQRKRESPERIEHPLWSGRCV